MTFVPLGRYDGHLDGYLVALVPVPRVEAQAVNDNGLMVFH